MSARVYARDEQFDYVVRCILREEVTTTGFNAVCAALELQKDAVRKAVNHRALVLQQRADRDSEDSHDAEVYAAFEQEDESTYRLRLEHTVDVFPIPFNLYAQPFGSESINRIIKHSAQQSIAHLRVACCDLRAVRLAVWEDSRYRTVFEKAAQFITFITAYIRFVEETCVESSITCHVTSGVTSDVPSGVTSGVTSL